jgi:hypothetical protein
MDLRFDNNFVRELPETPRLRIIAAGWSAPATRA